MPPRALIALACAALVACGGDRPFGILPTPAGNGPRVVWDLQATPLPNIPFPNDLATRADPSSPSGRRVNISEQAPTAIERKLRRDANRLDGFSTYGPLSVGFDAPLALDNIVARQRDNDDLDDDVILLVNIDPASEHYGEFAPLDVGHGNFPLLVPDLNQFWWGDRRAKVENLLFETTAEDLDGDGVLDPGEDTDGDGHLDEPNLDPLDGDPRDDLLTFYERETNTLIVRPLVPLQQQTRYAVVLTRNLTGIDGAPVRSPWQTINHTRQSAALAPLADVLAAKGLSLDDVAFSWSFTTQSTTRDLEALRAGLYGHGSLARLADEFPAQLELLPLLDEATNVHTLPSAPIQQLLEAFGTFVDIGFIKITEEGKAAAVASFDNIAYFVGGELTGPNLLADKDGVASEGYPADEDEVWALDRRSGEAHYGRHQIPFLCAIPRADRGKGAPFPVAIYMHGYGSTRLEQIAFAGNIARHGIASCTIDAFSHGLDLQGAEFLVEQAFKSYGMSKLLGQVAPGRARDLTNDGRPNVGGDIFSADLFHGRDALRQTVLDAMVLVRALRGFDGERHGQDLDGDGQPELAGDFNGDGTIDIGGPDVAYYTWGTSLGGITSSVLAGIEPAIVAAAPQAGGGGLLDIALRTEQSSVLDSTLLRILGPIYVTRPSQDEEGKLDLYTILSSANDHERIKLIKGIELAAGDRVEIENLALGSKHVTYADADGFRLQVPANALSATERRVMFGLDPRASGFQPHVLEDTTVAGDPLVIRIFGPGEEGRPTAPKVEYATFVEQASFQGLTYPVGQPLVALAPGIGRQRNTPAFRQLMSVAQTALDPADPINYAPHFRIDPLPADYDKAEPGANVLVIAIAGDTTVPVATGVALARAAGAVDYRNIDARFGKSVNQTLIDNFVLEGLSRLKRFGDQEILVDPEDFSRGVHAPAAPRLAAPLRAQRESDAGITALRIPLLDPAGQHAFLIPNPQAPFDNDAFLIHMVARFLLSGGRELPDDPCMATASCEWIPPKAEPLAPDATR